MDYESPDNKPENEATGIEEKESSNTLTIILAGALVLALAVIAALLLFNVFGGDADSDPGDAVILPTAEPGDFPLQGTTWFLANPIEGTTISLIFAGDSLSGSAGCNEYNANYSSTRAAGSANNISVGPISSSQAICDEPVMDQEQNYLANLAATSRYGISGDTLTLTMDQGTLVFEAGVTTQ